MSMINKYKFSFLLFLSAFIMFVTTVWSNVPTEGVYSHIEPPTVSFRFGYSGMEGADMEQWTKQRTDNAFYAASAKVLLSGEQPPSFSVYPVYDGSVTLEQVNEAFPNIPSDMLEGYGKTVYSIDYGNARLLFLNAIRLQEPGDSQLDWLEEAVIKNKRTHNVVWLSEDPRIPELWETMGTVGIETVMIRDEIYALNSAVAQQPSDYTPSAYEGWGVWKPAALNAGRFIAVIEGKDSLLTIKAEDEQGNVLDQLEQDAGNLANRDPKIEEPLVGIRSIWLYRVGDREIQGIIPEGFDITGEHPTTESFGVPPHDWRSPEYDDSAWKSGRSPLGHTNDDELKPFLQTKLKADAGSPAYYFRKSFEIGEDPLTWSGLTLHMTFEDGFVVYLNGNEVARDGISNGLLTPYSLAEPNQLSLYRTYNLKGHLNKLIRGTNTIAVEVHRSHPEAPNLFFDLSLSYEKREE